MKKICFVLALLFFAITFWGNIQDTLIAVDQMYKESLYSEGQELLNELLPQAANNKEKAEIYWRLSRTILAIGDDLEDSGGSAAERLKLYEEGEAMADKTIELNSQSHLGYYWKSANIGRWGQTKGILDSLFKAEPMRQLLDKAINMDENHADSFYVLGELYDELPGWPISFGNLDASVSMARRSVVLNQQQSRSGEEDKNYDFSIKLAKHLFKRNWNQNQRLSKQKEFKSKWDKTNDNRLKKYFYYEGTLTIPAVSDREEAKKILGDVIAELESMKRNKSQEKDLKNAKKLLSQNK